MSEVKDWDLYEAGKKYNNQIRCINNANYYDLVDALIDFVNGNQWRNMEITGMRKPVFNVMSKALRYWVASIAPGNTKISLEPLQYSQNPNDLVNIAEFASAELMNIFEKVKIDIRNRDALFKAGTIGDVAKHWYFDPTKKPYGGAFQDIEGEICFELINGTNIFFGNANNPSIDVNIQPYIGISGRDLAKNLTAEKLRYKKMQQELTEEESGESEIQEDKDYGNEAGIEAENEIEADGYGKATYFLNYRYNPDTKTIFASKCVKDDYIYKDIDTELSVYPISWLVWDKQENQYHGKPPLAEVMETQIFINLMFAMIMFHLSMTAFPKAIYDVDKIAVWNNKIAEAIPVKNLSPGDNIKNLAGYLEPGQMSNQIVEVIRIAYEFMKDILGINEAALGEINPEEASGKAILATVKQSSIPLENTRSNLYDSIEDDGKILLDIMGVNYGLRPIVIEKNGVKTVKQFDFSVLKNIWLNVRVDVGTSNVFDDRARKETLTNLLIQGKIELLDWLEGVDDKDLPNRQKLIDKIKASINGQQMAAFDKFISQLSPQLQQAIARESQAMMGGVINGGEPAVNMPMRK